MFNPNYEAAIPRLGVALVVLWLTWKIWAFFKPRNQHSLRSVAIVVLGDIGRSPRMMYHAESFAENEFYTDLIGYGGTSINAPLSLYRMFSRLCTHTVVGAAQYEDTVPTRTPTVAARVSFHHICANKSHTPSFLHIH